MKQFKGLVLSLALLTSGVAFGQRSSNVEMPVYKDYWIQSAMSYGSSSGYWDIPGKSSIIQKGANIQVWNIDHGIDRKYTLRKSSENGFYEIYVGGDTGKRVDVSSGKSANGTNVGVWDRNSGANQRFAFVHLGNGRFKIYDRNGNIICLEGRKNNNGTNVHMWNDHNGSFVEWYLIDPSTNSAYIPNAKPSPTAKPAPKPTPKPTPSGGKKVMPTKR
ncbi:MAG: RICIN domain-containing protein [Salinivirgaceae bacterium]|nr:RICIN domain-containing protein [Salinivirgaceae bacterium]